MQEHFFSSGKRAIEDLMDTILIFHCEFSQHRGPKMYRAVRGVDREIHANFYPQIFYPEMYLLEGGYKAFHSQFPELCTGTYLPMADKSFKTDCKD